MALEILGSRVLAPRYGSSVYVWGSLISTFLAALAVGYAWGGRMADRRPSPAVLSIILSIAAVLILPCVIWGAALLDMLARSGLESRWAVLLAAILLFLPPSLAMGMVTPFAVRIAIPRMEAAGAIAGGYSALSTAGSIAGTLLTTFVLIPAFAVTNLLLALAGTLVLSALLLVRGRASVAIAVLAASGCGLAGFVRRDVAGTERLLLRKDTAYHHITVTELDQTRWMRFDGRTQGAVNMAHPDRALLPHEQGLPLAFAIRPRIQSVCMIGLGAGVIPRAVSRFWPDIFFETVEIDPVVLHIAREFFLYRESDHTKTVIEDGRAFLARDGRTYDLIILDAFNSTGVPFHLTTREFFETVRRRLSPDGILAANFYGLWMGRDSRLFWSTYQTIRRQFGQVYVANSDIEAGRTKVMGNVFVFATISADPVSKEIVRRNAQEISDKFRFSGPLFFSSLLVHSPEPPPGTLELTDAYAPVEALQSF
jgi:spermidine synthase